MTIEISERRLLEELFEWLLRDSKPVQLADGRTSEQSAEFRAEERLERKKRLRMFRQKRKDGTLSIGDLQILDSLESSSVYSNQYASVTNRKPTGKKSLGNIEEAKRLYVAKLLSLTLHPGKNPYEFLENETRYERANPRALEMRIGEFEKHQINGRMLSSARIVEEQFDRFKLNEVMAGSFPDKPKYRELVYGTVANRWRSHMRLRDKLRRTQPHSNLLSDLCDGFSKQRKNPL